MNGRIRIKLGWCIGVFALLLAGCAPLSTRRVLMADNVVAMSASTALDCAAPEHCARPSPFIEQADRALAASTPGHPQNTATLLNIGQNALVARLNLIHAARKSIDIQTYIWSSHDDAGLLMLDALVKAARRGVKVRILADQLWSLDDPTLLWRLARASSNLKIKLYNPTFDNADKSVAEYTAAVICCFHSFDRRMHQKLFLVDDKVGIVGGRNYANAYFDWDSERDYIDREVLVAGAVGREMHRAFQLFWHSPKAVPLTRLRDVNAEILAHPFETNPWTPPRFADPQRVALVRREAASRRWLADHLLDHSLNVGRARYFYDLPRRVAAEHDRPARELNLEFRKLLRGAKHQIVLQTPYLLITRRAGKIFDALRKRRPAVRVIVSTDSLATTDQVPVYALTYKHHRQYLVDYGFRIHELMPHPADAPKLLADYYSLSGIGSAKASLRLRARVPIRPGQPGPRLALHAKSLVVDGRIALVGSDNFDPRSTYINVESAVVIDNRAFAAEVRASILRDAAPQNAWLVAPRFPATIVGKANVAIGDFSRSLPVFDVWPFAYATDYQLKPGGRPVPATSPDFLENWEPVGDFPEVNLSLTAIITRFITAFGAPVHGIL